MTSEQLADRLSRIEAILQDLVEQRTIKDFYTIAEVAKLISRSEYTVREWARTGRVHAQKRPSGRGAYLEWMISHAELSRIRGQGILPAKPWEQNGNNVGHISTQ